MIAVDMGSVTKSLGSVRVDLLIEVTIVVALVMRSCVRTGDTVVLELFVFVRVMNGTVRTAFIKNAKKTAGNTVNAF